MLNIFILLDFVSEWFWTVSLRLRLLLIGCGLTNAKALGPVRIRGFSRGAELKIGRGVIFHPWSDLKFRGPSSIDIGDDVVLDFGVRIVAAMGFKCKLDDGVQLGYGTIINAGESVYIGRNTVVGGGCLLQASEHVLDPESDMGIYTHCYRRGEISVGEGSWLASNVIVRPSTNIGSRVVIGANSIVKGDYLEAGTYAGSPRAERIK